MLRCCRAIAAGVQQKKNPHRNRAQGTTREIPVQYQRCPSPLSLGHAATSATAQPREIRPHWAQSSKRTQAKEQQKLSHCLTEGELKIER